MNRPKVLVIDDEEVVRSFFKKLGERKGLDVTVTKNSEQAVEKIKSKSFDVVVVDIRMPIVNGLETFRLIKEIRPDIPVIMMTGSHEDALVEAALSEGALDCVYKPFDLKKMLDTIDRAYKNKQ